MMGDAAMNDAIRAALLKTGRVDTAAWLRVHPWGALVVTSQVRSRFDQLVAQIRSLLHTRRYAETTEAGGITRFDVQDSQYPGLRWVYAFPDGRIAAAPEYRASTQAMVTRAWPTIAQVQAALSATGET